MSVRKYIMGRTSCMPAIFGVALLFAFAVSLDAGTGTVDKATGWYPAGSNITATATPALYSIFDRWGGDTNGASFPSSVQITVNVTGPKVVQAVFTNRVTATNSVPYQWLADVLGISTGFEDVVSEDTDGDGFSNAEEYWSGTDPMTNSSCLHIAEVEMTTTNFRLIWAHADIGAYKPQVTVQSRGSMGGGSWSNAVSLPVTNGMNSWSPTGQMEAFYRLCVTNVP